MIHILVVEDDTKLNQIVCTYLNDSGFQTKGCLNAKEAYEEMYNNLYDLIISDIMMPEIDGFEFARTVRQVNRTIPILFMSAKDDLPSKQKGFQLGIDDYMVKPIELDELLLRVRALLRRANIEMERKITVGNLVLDADGMSAEIDGEEISLTTRELNLDSEKVKDNLFPLSLFAIYLGVLLLMSGVYTGLLVLMDRVKWNGLVQTIVPMVYWGLVAVGLTLFTRKKMKTPIAIIKNYAQLLQAGHVSEEQGKEYAENIEQAAARLSLLIGNILKLNRLEHQRITPEVETYDVCRQLCESVFLFEDALEDKEIELEADIEDAALIKADASLMELVWNNLLSNAVKFTDRGGSITIRQISDESYVRVSISDTGCGIAKESINHIFDKFYQGDTSHAMEGNGLGLALVKRVLELSDGEIQIISEKGKGSTFLVTLPVAGAEH